MKFYYSGGIAHKEFIYKGTAVNTSFYQQLLDLLGKRIRRVRSEWWIECCLFFLYDNAPLHTVTINT